jgi:hypothetical protein
VPLPRSRTPAAPALRCHCRNQVLPPRTERRRPQHSTDFRGSITRLQHSLSTLPASVSLHWQDSLPVGGRPLPDGLQTHGTPKRISRMVAIPYYPNAPGLAWRHLCLCGEKWKQFAAPLSYYPLQTTPAALPCGGIGPFVRRKGLSQASEGVHRRPFPYTRCQGRSPPAARKPQ